MTDINWSNIISAVKEKKTSWIQEQKKENLVTICEKFGIEYTVNDTLDELRNKARTWVQSYRDESNYDFFKESSEQQLVVQKAKMSTLIGMMKPFQKGNAWNAFSSQLDAFITFNDLPEQKIASFLLTRLSAEVFTDLKASCTDDILKMTYEDLKKKLTDIYEPEKILLLNALRLETGNKNQMKQFKNM